MEVAPEKVAKIVLAVCCLHNYSMKLNSQYVSARDFDRYDYGELQPGLWRAEVAHGLGGPPLQHVNAPQPSDGISVRNLLKTYFLTAHGEVPWQYDIFKS